jgi:hypothetical protein
MGGKARVKNVRKDRPNKNIEEARNVEDRSMLVKYCRHEQKQEIINTKVMK